MSGSFAIRRNLLGTVLVLLFLSTFAHSAFAAVATTTVSCVGANDHDAIQNAVNNSAPGDTIKLIGTCQLDGRAIIISHSNLTIEGPGASGNWATVISGLSDSGGMPLGDQGGYPFGWFNRGFSVQMPLNGSISGVTIQGIKFVNLNYAVNISPSIAGNSNLCAATQIVTGATASTILVANNWFDNVVRAVSNLGSSDQIYVTGNLITNSGFADSFGLRADINSAGGFLPCKNADGSHSSLAIQFPAHLTYQANVITNDHASFPIFVFPDVQSVSIIKNTITTGNAFDLIVFAAQNAYVSQNVLDGQGGSLGGIFGNQTLQLSSPQYQIKNNSITNINGTNSNGYGVPVGIGIGVDSGIFGPSIVNNQFDSSAVVDILLCDATANTTAIAAVQCDGGGIASHDNKVIINSGTTVSDLGVNNKILVN